MINRRREAQLGARTPLQLAAMCVLILVAVFGMTCILAGHRGLGSSFVGLAVVAVAPFSFWMRATQLPPR